MANSIVVPVGTATSPFMTSHSSRVVASELVALLKSMFDESNGSTRIDESTINMDDLRYQFRIKSAKVQYNQGNILQLPQIMVASDIMAHRGYAIDSAISEVGSQLGPESQLQMLNQLLTTLNEYPKRDQYSTTMVWEMEVKKFFEETLPRQKEWIKTFRKYEIAILNKSQCREWVESLNDFNRSKLQSINDRRVETITLLAVIEKGISNLQEDVMKKKLNLNFLPALHKIVTQLKDSHTGA